MSNLVAEGRVIIPNKASVFHHHGQAWMNHLTLLVGSNVWYAPLPALLAYTTDTCTPVCSPRPPMRTRGVME